MNRLLTFSSTMFLAKVCTWSAILFFAGSSMVTVASPLKSAATADILPEETVLTMQGAIAQDTDMSAPSSASASAMDGNESAMSFFDLLRQAGSIRYAIFAVFVIGLFLIVLKVIDVYSDKSRGTALLENSYQNMNLKDIATDVSAETSHMMSTISSTLLNVYQTSLNAENLQDEISTFSRIQQEKYNSFAKRVDFLSDTAGALGLLGTVWGMFMVFSSGSLEKDTILAGMGVALLTTLLGLVVSITLNFFSTLLQGYFSGHLEQVVQKADELRFRLLEISQSSNGNQGNG